MENNRPKMHVLRGGFWMHCPKSQFDQTVTARLVNVIQHFTQFINHVYLHWQRQFLRKGAWDGGRFQNFLYRIAILFVKTIFNV